MTELRHLTAELTGDIQSLLVLNSLIVSALYLHCCTDNQFRYFLFLLRMCLIDVHLRRKSSQFCAAVVQRQIARYPWISAAVFCNLAIASAGNVENIINYQDIEQNYSYCVIRNPFNFATNFLLTLVALFLTQTLQI